MDDISTHLRLEKMTWNRAESVRRPKRKYPDGRQKHSLANSQRERCPQFGDEWLISVIYVFFSARSPTLAYCYAQNYVCTSSTLVRRTPVGPIPRPPAVDPIWYGLTYNCRRRQKSIMLSRPAAGRKIVLQPCVKCDKINWLTIRRNPEFPGR